MGGISASQLQRFDDCPYKYYLHYVKKLDAILWDATIFDVGSYVHDTVDSYYKTCFGENKTYNEVLYDSYHILKGMWDRFLPPEHFKRAYDCLENFAKFEINRLKADMIKPLTEIKVPAKGYYGIIDFYNPATQKAIDWKTGKNAYLSRSYKIQSVVYKILLDNKFKIDLEKFHFMFLQSGIPRKVELKSKKMDEIFDFVNEGREKILEAKKEESFDKKPRTDKMCDWCEYSYYCKRLKI
jgi:CRISPR/Cas system-associated exonuclease Cas4 (RecB family)